jgi:hypothetical protein
LFGSIQTTFRDAVGKVCVNRMHVSRSASAQIPMNADATAKQVLGNAAPFFEHAIIATAHQDDVRGLEAPYFQTDIRQTRSDT